MERVYTMEEIQSLLTNLDNGIEKPGERIMRTKLPIPEEYGGGWATGKTVEEAVAKLIERVKSRGPASTDDILFTDCSERWISIKMGEKRSASTIANYRRILKRYLIPYFGKQYMGKIKAEDIQKYFNKYMTK